MPGDLRWLGGDLCDPCADWLAGAQGTGASGALLLIYPLALIALIAILLVGDVI
jgi:hypothetical protein